MLKNVVTLSLWLFSNEEGAVIASPSYTCVKLVLANLMYRALAKKTSSSVQQYSPTGIAWFNGIFFC